MATMKNKQTARKMTIDAEKLDDIMGMCHTAYQEMKQKNEKLKEKLKLSIQVNEELRKENSEIIPELQSKNMIQFQSIHKLQEENEKLKDELQHKSEVCVGLQRLADEEHIRYLDIQVKASEQYPKLKNKIEKQQTQILQLCSENERLKHNYQDAVKQIAILEDREEQ